MPSRKKSNFVSKLESEFEKKISLTVTSKKVIFGAKIPMRSEIRILIIWVKNLVKNRRDIALISQNVNKLSREFFIFCDFDRFFLLNLLIHPV